MWGVNAGLAWLAATTQLSFRPYDAQPILKAPKVPGARSDFKLVEGKHILSPKTMLELPRPGNGVANSAGDLTLVPLSQYGFDENGERICDEILSTPNLPLFDGGEAFWIDDRTIGHVRPGSDGKSSQELYAVSVEYTVDTTTVTPKSPVRVGEFPDAQLSNFKYSKSGALVFSAYVYEDRNLSSFVSEQDEKWRNRGNTALVYDENFVRHWDEYRGPKRQALFSVDLKKNKGEWTLGEEVFALQLPQHSTPVEPFGGAEDFDVSETHVLYTTKDPNVPEALHTRQNVYLAPLRPAPGSDLVRELTSGIQGATHNPVLSKDGKKAAWAEMERDGYESDRSKLVVYDIEAGVRFTITENWDQSVADLTFTPDGKSIIFTSGHNAKILLYTIPVPPTPAHSDMHLPVVIPIALTPSTLRRTLRLSPEDVEPEEFWFTGAKDKRVQGWIVRPPGLTKGKKYPVVLLIHGGPQSAWEDNWSTRWNPQVFAQQGYVVVTINPTDELTMQRYIPEFTDAIAEDWGGRPFEDLRKGWKHVLDNYEEVDGDRAVAAGASWGGYAINWIQSHPEWNFNFKALVCHDGVFDTVYNGFATDELYFFNHDFGGPPWSRRGREAAEKFSPVNRVSHWSTPQLIIHGSRDYRLAETEGLSVFNALQSRGIPSRIVIFPDENHWVLKPGNSLKWHYEVFRWFDQWVGTDKEYEGIRNAEDRASVAIAPVMTTTTKPSQLIKGFVPETFPPSCLSSFPSVAHYCVANPAHLSCHLSPLTTTMQTAEVPPPSPSFEPNDIPDAIDYTQNISTLLRTSTKRAHNAVHHSELAGKLLRGELPKNEYIYFMMLLWRVYKRARDPFDKPGAGTNIPTGVAKPSRLSLRRHRILLDTTEDAWQSTPLYRSLISAPPAGLRDYVAHLEQLAVSKDSTDNSRLLAHAYVRFYDFGSLQGSAGTGEKRASQGELLKIKEWYRAGMNEAVGDDRALKEALDVATATKDTEPSDYTSQSKVVFDDSQAPEENTYPISSVVAFVMALALAHFTLVVGGFTGARGTEKFESFVLWLRELLG
ncbi:Alpha beta-hydrolase [Rhizoctonia solani]|uniref:Dipeptidyl-peptidase V n=1 Tax=Rhizoctonia solani TaxID=456999 RepID=A0A8H7IAY3_9AGAM|nr:Alpha beta-hydrolase [Rhizoctonia solani]